MAGLARGNIRPRRGIALMDAILAGVMLGVGLAVMLTLASRAVALQSHGQKQLVAAWLVDELLSMVLVEGPDVYDQLYPTSGHFDAPFDDYFYDVYLEDIGVREPYRVTAVVSWPHGVETRQVSAQTYVAVRLGDPIPVRAPLEPIDRLGRYYDDEGF